jgi:hypothetical protein
MPGPGLTGTQTATKNYLVFDQFETMDTQQVRVGLPPARLAWLENLMPIGPNYLFTVPAPLAPLTNIVGKSITESFYAFFANTDFQIAFTSDGAAYTINLATGAQMRFAPPATFTDPDVAQWKSERIVIADPTAGYCTYDGTAFVISGGVSPSITVTAGGSGYTSGATAAITGGSGSGATATVTVVAGVVTALVLTNAGTGYKSGDTLTVTITAVGAGSGATATAKVWPQFSLTPTTLAVYSGRVWLGGGRALQWTGTGGFDDAATANAAGTTILPDSDLVHQITALRALNNYLWIFGDNSIKQIGTVSVSGSTTVFSIVTLSSDTGTLFPQSILSYNRLVLFANKTGVYAVLGASVQKISNQMDGIFQNLNFNLPLQAALNDIGSAGIGGGSIRCYMLLASYVDPIANTTRSIIMTFFSQKWFIINQGNNIQSMSTAVINGSLETFASSGSDVTQILQNPQAPVNFLLRTALANDGKPHMGKRALRAGVTQVSNVNGTVTMTIDSELGSQPANYTVGFPITWVNNQGQIIRWLNTLGQLITFVGKGILFQRVAAQNSGIYLGVTMSGSFSQYSVNNIIIEYQDSAVLVSNPSE